jgi:DNA/RNA endonuclease YhcR with UshA esterase domain
MEQETKTQITPEERYQKETHCPSCGRFTGVYTRCPYCQALIEKRLSIRVFKWVAVLTSTVGLMLLLFYAKHVQTPEVKISELGPLSNFAHVRIQGEVERSFGIHPKWGSLGFIIAQGGEGNEQQTIRVSAYAKVAKEIENRKLVPVKGDIVSVEGQVRFQKDTPSLLINAPEHISFLKKGDKEPETVKNVDPDKLDHSHLGSYVSVTGSVLSTRSFATGMIVNVDNGSSGLPVWIPKQYLPEDSNLHPGDLVEAVGKVETFKDKLEVKVTRKNAFKIVSRVSTNPTAEETD